MKVPDLFLIVDDDPTNNIICKTVIKKHYPSTEVKAFQNPELALNFLRTQFGDFTGSTLMLLDINMPQLSGWEVVEQIVNMPKVANRLTIYILSSSEDEADIEKAGSYSSISGYLSKPLLGNTLRKILD